MKTKLPPFLRDLLANPPAAGAGVHGWMFTVARQLHAHLPSCDISSLLERLVANCGRHVSRTEIDDAVKNSIPCAWRSKGTAGPVAVTAKWPRVNQEKRAAVLCENGGLADLWGHSETRTEDGGNHTEEIIDRLFPGNPLLCCGRSQSDFNTLPREAWRGELEKMQFIVPSPMSAITGLTKNHKVSAHTLSNTGPRRFLVVEFDEGTLDEQAALLIHLADHGPLVCANHSGDKSLHGWFYCPPEDKVMVARFFRYAVSLGADHRLWTRSQFCRMPDGKRNNGHRQTVYFLNFKSVEASNESISNQIL